MTRDKRRMLLTELDLRRAKPAARARLARALGLSPFASNHAILAVANTEPRARRGVA